MKKYLFSILASIIIAVFSSFAIAEEIQFPTTAEEIIKLLQFKDEMATFQGKKYQVKNGEVYQIDRKGKRWKLRGFDDIVEAGITPKVAAKVLFEVNSAVLDRRAYRILKEFGKALTSKELSGYIIQIQGHTDSDGPLAYNHKLSKKRAMSVRDYLFEQFQIGPNRLKTEGFGEEKPIFPNDTPGHKQINRRVQFVVLGKL